MNENIYNPLESSEKPDLVLDLHDGTNAQISIIVVHHDRPEYLNICLQSIYIMSNLNNFELIVVDNNSGPDSLEYLNVLEQEGIKIIRNKDNKYWSAAANQGVAIADPNSQYYVFLHCDTVVLNPGWLDLLVNIAEAKSSGFVGTQMNQYVLNKQRVDYIQEWCLLMTKSCWQDIGPWPEELPLIGNAFTMSLKAQKKGYKPQAISNPIVHHYCSPSYDINEIESINHAAKSNLGKILQKI